MSFLLCFRGCSPAGGPLDPFRSKKTCKPQLHSEQQVLKGSPSIVHVDLRALRPLTAFKNAPNPKLVQNLSRRLFFGIPIRGTQICHNCVKKLKNDNFQTNVSNFDKFLANLGPTDWNPQKQSSGQIGGSGHFFEC